jgi:CheY-like chemotaxis protein
MSDESSPEARPMKVLVYSHHAATRDVIRLAIGRRPAPDVPRAEIIECATEPALFRRLDARGADIMILDGEAQPAGGMGVCRQAKDEIYDCPPALLVIGRADDGWLATWSRADAVVSQPIDPAALARALAGLMRTLLSRQAIEADGGTRHAPAAELATAGGDADGADGARTAVHGHDAPAQA